MRRNARLQKSQSTDLPTEGIPTHPTPYANMGIIFALSPSTLYTRQCHLLDLN